MADIKQETAATPARRNLDCSCYDLRWIIYTIEGWLKMIEAIMTFFTFVIASSFPGSFKAEYEFLIFVATTAFVFVVLHIVLQVTGYYARIPPALTQPLVGFLLCYLAALSLLVGSAVVFARGDVLRFPTLKASAICGFLSTVLFLCEGIYLFIVWRRSPRRRSREMQKPAEDIRSTDDFKQFDELPKV